jgi:hypothetical protein
LFIAPENQEKMQMFTQSDVTVSKEQAKNVPLLLIIPPAKL